jgi:trimethylamine--corrinoid protein Co-methyltransferase
LKLQGFTVLSEGEIDQIHNKSLVVLDRVGVEVQDAGARELFRQAGARVEAGSDRVHIPRELVESALGSAPSEFSLFDRNLSPGIQLSSGRIYATTGSNSKLVVDINTGEYRPSTKQDAGDFARLADALDNISIVIPEVNPQDVPPESMALHALEAVFNNTEKHVMYEVHEAKSTTALLDMGQVIAGETPLASKSPLSVFCSITSPLVWSTGAVLSLMETAKRGVPCCLIPCPIPGMTSPMSLSGTMVQQGAEFLSGLVLMQIVHRGTPVLYFAPPLSADMRYGTVVYSGPEVMLLGTAGRQMAEYYKVPLFQSGFDTDSQCEDVQSAWDKALAVLCGIGGVSAVFKNAGSIGNGLIASAVHLVLDDEFFGICLRLAEGLEVSDDALAAELIEKVGPGGSFLAQPHTISHLRSEHRIPKVLNRLTYDRWRAAGGRDVMSVARDKATAVLQTHHPRALPEYQKASLHEITRSFEVERSLG